MLINDTATARVIMDPEAVGAYIRQGNGPVMRDMSVRAERVQAAAKRQVRLGHVGGGERNANKRAVLRPNLRNTIVKRVVRGTDGNPSVLVGSASPIALLHHEGTRPHIIRPRNARVLVFWSMRGGAHMVFAKQVNHPGTRPNRYLTDNLHLAL